MNITSPRRPHLAERVVDAARTAAAAARQAQRPQFTTVPLDPYDSDGAGQLLDASAPTRVPLATLPLREEAPPIGRDTLERAGLVGQAQTRRMPREEIALVREQVLRTVEATAPAPGRDGRIVLVTSARAGEGKSFAALNIAASMAEGAGRQVILIDTEGGAGSLTALLDLEEAPGLEALQAMAGADPAALTLPTAVHGLSVLPRGRSGPAQADAIAAGLLRLATRLPQHVFVLDTPACLEASTAGLLAAVAGQVVMVVRAERTQRAEVEAALDIVDACPNLQLLLNLLTLKVSSSFGGRDQHTEYAAARGQG
ncbi:P-loop NTPase family protein [Neoroseomonas lacus]|uniref:Uncharacterized protein n=1 Tax=Neoroseomonas lacus TaxID=287609 RepID=A0A917K4R6_9PROT|nr:hypothetical protein [Neoroseomonas lacus]GGI97462.1 hypothetical protein GCM10011320_00100 [Neoroseomonas lacus]